ncbi:MAG TPA: hypothetical protein VGE74_29990 [Gemmata sp.]
MTLSLLPLDPRRALAVGLFAIAFLWALSATARADEPTRYYLGEDGQVVTVKEFADLKREVAALKKEVAELKACTCTGECCKKATASAAPTASAVVSAPSAQPSFLTIEGRPHQLAADGRYWPLGAFPGASPTAFAPAAFAAPTCSGPGCSALPSYLPQFAPQYILPGAPQSCPGGRCPTPR